MATFKAKVLDTGSGALKRFRGDIVSPRNALFLGRMARTLMTIRTGKGVDQHGIPFAPYSKKIYRAPIAKRQPGQPKPQGGRAKSLGKKQRSLKNMVFSAGYAAYKLGIGRGIKVQLSITQQMLQDIQVAVEAAGKRVVLFFFSARSRAIAHGHVTGANNLPVRDFFGVGDVKTIATLKQAYIRLIREAKGRAGL